MGWVEYALKAVEKRESVHRAAELYSVPKSTLYDRMSGRVTEGAKSGPLPSLTIEE